MRPPTTVNVGPSRYRVEFDYEALAQHEHEQRLGPIDGFCWYSACRIVLKPGLARDREAVTVVHEVLHAMLDTAGLGEDLQAVPYPGDLEEAVINRLAPVLLDVLRRNPRLVSYLLER